MPLRIIRQDITKLKCDAIVNAANSTLLGGGGVDGAIHKAAGKGLLAECVKLGGCKVGQAKITGAYKLPAKFVIHTVGPKWKGGNNGEKELLESCYRESLKIALENNCESVAFPLISSGAYGYPKAEALKVAVDTITSFLTDEEMLVYITVFDKSAFQIGEKLFSDIASFIDDKYVDTHFIKNRLRSEVYEESVPPMATSMKCTENEPICYSKGNTALPNEKKSESLYDAIRQIDESFSQMLLRKIDEKGISDVECYKKANVDRKLFSKIRSDINYKPSKTTAIAFAVSLELSLEETEDMLKKAGFALSHSNKFDIIIEYFITHKNYNVFEINEALFAFDQSLLGV